MKKAQIESVGMGHWALGRVWGVGCEVWGVGKLHTTISRSLSCSS